MSLFKKMEEISLDTSLTALIYGDIGSGKTTLALGAGKKVALIDTDNGVNRVNMLHLKSVDTLQVKSYAEVLEALDSEEIKQYDTIVIDTMGKLIDYIMLYVQKLSIKNDNRSGGLSQQGWGVLNQIFKDLCRKIRALRTNLVLVAHKLEQSQADRMKFVPLIRHGNYMLLSTELNLIGYVDYVGNERTLSFAPTELHDTKDTIGFPPLMKIPTMKEGDANDWFYNNVVMKHIENIENKKKLQQGFTDILAQIDDAIYYCNSDIEVNEFIQGINSFKHQGSSLEYAKKQIVAKAKAIGLTYNKVTKSYEYAPTV